MPIELNGQTVGDITLNGDTIDEVTVNGTTVYTSVSGPEPGTHFYVGSDSQTRHYTLSTPYDLNTATLTSTLSGNRDALSITPDGTRIFTRGEFSTTIEQYDLTTPFDLDTATNQTNFGGFFENSFGASDHEFGQGGTLLYVGDADSNGYEEYTLSTPYDLNTRTLTDSKVTLPQDSNQQGGGIVWNADGTTVIYGETNQNSIFQSSLSTPFDFNTASFDTSFTANSDDPTGIAISNDGTRLFAKHFSPNEVTVYDLSTPFDISNTSFVGTFFTDLGFSGSCTFNGNPWL